KGTHGTPIHNAHYAQPQADHQYTLHGYVLLRSGNSHTLQRSKNRAEGTGIHARGTAAKDGRRLVSGARAKKRIRRGREARVRLGVSTGMATMLRKAADFPPSVRSVLPGTVWL